jgi:pyruvate ferredoxin oxidoreductase beta subunit
MSKGQKTWKKNLPEIMVAHEIPYVATASPSYPFDLIRKVKRAVEVDGPAYLHVLAVCPTGWRSAGEETIRLGRLAAECGVFPLYEVDQGKYTINLDPGELKPMKEYLELQGRFRHLKPEDLEYIENRVHANFEKLRAKARMTAGEDKASPKASKEKPKKGKAAPRSKK